MAKAKVKATKKRRGEKFTEKYGLATANLYRGNAPSIRIPPPGHPLHDATSPTTFDELRVRAIDRDGMMTDAIEVWTDPDSGILWITDGRSRWLDVQEVNRRRKLEGRELVEPYIVPFTRKSGKPEEKDAVARVREKNYHRRVPTMSEKAVDLKALRDAGHPWARCAEILHLTPMPADTEQWGRKLLPLAFCVPDVRAAFDAGELPQSAIRKFGGTKPDGSGALSPHDQLALLTRLTADRTLGPADGAEPKTRPMSRTQRLAVAEKLSEGHATNRVVSGLFQSVAAVLRFLDGDKAALDGFPSIKPVVEEALSAKSEAAEAAA